MVFSRQCLILRTVLSQLSHEQAVRQHNQVHVPCLALAVAKLTISHAKLLLTVPMIGLRSCPAMSIGLQYATHFPCCPVGDQDLARFGVTAVIPKDDDTYFVVYFGNVQCTGEAPLPLVAATQFLAVFRRDRSRHCIGPQFLSLPLQLAIELQVADVPPRPFILVLLGVNVIQILGIGEIAVEYEISRDVPLADPINQLAKQLRMVQESLARRFALIALFETAEFQRECLPLRT